MLPLALGCLSTMSTMISREPTLERLAVAHGLLLAPHGLNETHLKKALGEILSHGADDADLYFQYTRSEGWSLEEGIVKSGSFSIDQGVGVRAVSGEKTAFAYSDDLSWSALQDAAHTVRTIGAHGQQAKVKVGAKKVARSRSLYAGLDPIPTLDSTAKVALLVGLFEPFMLVFMGAVVLVIVLAILLPILSLNQLVG